jgi:hypothetical protein
VPGELTVQSTGRAPAGASGPWEWRPSRSSWFARFADLAERWEPSAELELDAVRLRRVLLDAATAGERWLLHPCVSAITFPRNEYRLQRDFQLAVWTSLSAAVPLGQVSVPQPLWAWSPGGGTSVPAGRHDLAKLVGLLAAHNSPGALALDPWARSINISFNQLWRDEEIYGPEQQATLQAELRRFLRASAATERCLTPCFEWITSATQVVIPLRQVSGERSDSSSTPQLPGVIFLTLQRELQIIEALVHETAHQHLFLAEAEGALVDDAHTATYRSPLRPDPRPLRGVLLAYHALAYISACYTDALDQGLVPGPRLESELQEVRLRMHEAQDIIVSNRRHLTELGRVFADRTAEVASYGV